MNLDSVTISSKEYLELKQYKRLYELQRDMRYQEHLRQRAAVWGAAKDTVFTLALLIVGSVVITGIAVFLRETFR